MIKSVLVLGSGAIKVAEAAEFDYSGSQALKAFREEGIGTVLMNPNVATIQTSKVLADRVYFLPLSPEFAELVIERERPDAIVCGFGGQTALSLCVELNDRGVLDRYGVEVLGTPIEGIRTALSRDRFRKAMEKAGIPMPPSVAARDPEGALEAALSMGFPVMVRVSFNLGGAGAFVAYSREELQSRIYKAFAQSSIKEVLVEKYLDGWKEVEFEVVRDAHGNKAAVVCMENVDPMGIHTGDSIVVAPCQTLTDEEYQWGRVLSMGVADAIGLVGEGNVQLAVNYGGPEQYVIETNPRMSRSSALASKASGYPLAYIAAKLALGYRLDEVVNQVTRRTVAAFEPSLDYIVVKHPRWENDRFGIREGLGPEMMSIGEVMGIGRTLEEAWQKAIRMLDIGEPGLVGGRMYQSASKERALEALRGREPYWPIYAARAMELGVTVDEIHSITKVDRFFLNAIKRVVDLYMALRSNGQREDLIEEALVLGFTRDQISEIIGNSNTSRMPAIKRIDTLAGEWEASTNYLYMSYGGEYDDVVPGTDFLVVGAGVFRIGVSVEFDWSTVNMALSLKRRGYRVAILNYNPETVSTDWDLVDRLYFDEISLERIVDIFVKEGGPTVILYAGGQIGQRLYTLLEQRGVRIGGTRARSVDVGESRNSFSAFLDELGIPQPEWYYAKDMGEAIKLAESMGYPVLVRPSYVLGGTYMAVAYNEAQLVDFLRRAAIVGERYPVVVSRYMPWGIEAEIDAVSDGRALVATPIEHVEPPGVHSGDSTMVLPPRKLTRSQLGKMLEITHVIARELEVKGPLNVQFIVADDVYVVEANLRVSRSMPLVSKATGVNYMDLVADVLTEERLKVDDDLVVLTPGRWWVKSPQFSWSRLRGAYPRLGPVMYSTGEVASFSSDFHDALLKSWLSATPNRIPRRNALVYTYDDAYKKDIEKVRSALGYLDVMDPESVGMDRLIDALKGGRIDIVITAGDTPDMDYRIRRISADTSTPLVLHPSLAMELAEAFRKGLKMHVEPW